MFVEKFSILSIIEENMANNTVIQSTIQLPKPEFKHNLSLFEALQRRSSSRSFSQRPLDEQTISNLLWAAFGVNRPETGGRTAPSAVNWQEYDLYLTTNTATSIYRADTHTLELVAAKDLRAKTGSQEFVPGAPVNVVLVADLTRIGGDADTNRLYFVHEDAGYISQNIYLFCASEGLVTVVRATIDRDQLASALSLKPSQRIILAQTVGYPQDGK
jgi:nitroreductase